jgi:hypothetical protein
VKAAQLSCTGGTFTAAADPQLRQVLGAGKNPSGVRWAPRLKFCKMEEEYAELPCFFSICDGAVTFMNPVVTGMMGSDTIKNGETSICISGGTVTLVNGTFLQNTEVRPIRIAGKDTTANISNCRFIANSVTKTERPGGAVFVLNRARATIQSSKFVNNSAEVGGAVAVGGRSSLEVAQGCPAGPGEKAPTYPRVIFTPGCDCTASRNRTESFIVQCHCHVCRCFLTAVSKYSTPTCML